MTGKVTLAPLGAASASSASASGGSSVFLGGRARAFELSRRGDMASAPRLYLARALRDFGDGFAAVLLPVYLSALGFGAAEIGLIATAALLGSALMTIAIGALGSRHDHRKLLLAASGLMAATGVAFASLGDFALILLAAFAGTLNPSAGTVSVFVPLEHAMLSRSVSDVSRTRAFARYSLIGALAA